MNISGFYQTANKSISNISSFSSNQSSTPPKVNTTTDEFQKEVNFTNGLIIPDSSKLVIGSAQISSADLVDGSSIPMKDEDNVFTGQNIFNQIPKYNDGTSDFNFLVAAPDTSLSSGASGSHLTVTETTHDETSDTHTTSTTTIAVDPAVTTAHPEDPAISAASLAFSALTPDGAGGGEPTIAKKSPYKVVTGDENGALIGMYITDDAFLPWIMGENTGTVTDNKRLTADKYGHGLVPSGSVYVAGSTQEFLRKDGSWQNINLDLGNINTDLVSSLSTSHDIGSVSNPFKTLYINEIHLGLSGKFLSKNQIGEANNHIPTGYFGSVVVDNLSASNGTVALSGILNTTGNINCGGVITANNTTISDTLNVNKLNTDFFINNLIPFVNKTQHLGSDTNNWKTLFIDTVKANYLEPQSQSISHIGESTNKWFDAHIQTVNCDNLNAWRLLTLNLAVEGYFEGNLYPQNDLDRDIGSTSKRWRTVNCQNLNCDNLTLTNPSNSLIPDALTCTTLDASNGITATNTLTVGNSCVASRWANNSTNTYATFRHKDNILGENYALLSGPGGDTYLNGQSGLFLRISNVSVMDINANEIKTFQPIKVNTGIYPTTNLGVNIGGNDESFLAGYFKHIYGTSTTANSSGELQLKNINGGSGFIHIRQGLIQSSYQIQVSDRRIKHNIVPYADGWEDFKKIQVRTYNRYDETKQRVGVIADEIRDNSVPLIRDAYENTGTMEINGETYENFGSVGYETLYRMNLRITQQLQNRVEELEAKLNLLLNNNNGQATQ